MNEELRKINERLDFIEFRQELLFENTKVNRHLFANNITRNQYYEIMDLMDEYRRKIDNGEEVYHHTFEQEIYDITGIQGDYHFCEGMAKSFMEDNRWTEVFIALYGGMDKYKHIINR